MTGGFLLAIIAIVLAIVIAAPRYADPDIGAGPPGDGVDSLGVQRRVRGQEQGGGKGKGRFESGLHWVLSNFGCRMGCGGYHDTRCGATCENPRHGAWRW